MDQLDILGTDRYPQTRDSATEDIHPWEGGGVITTSSLMRKG